jgi:hypothetical protein
VTEQVGKTHENSLRSLFNRDVLIWMLRLFSFGCSWPPLAGAVAFGLLGDGSAVAEALFTALILFAFFQTLSIILSMLRSHCDSQVRPGQDEKKRKQSNVPSSQSTKNLLKRSFTMGSIASLLIMLLGAAPFLFLWAGGEVVATVGVRKCLHTGLVFALFLQTLCVQVGHSHYGSTAPSWDALPCLVVLLPQAASIHGASIMQGLRTVFWVAVPAGACLLWFLRRVGRQKRSPRPGVWGVLLAAVWLGYGAFLLWHFGALEDGMDVFVWGVWPPADAVYTSLARVVITVYLALCALDVLSVLGSHYQSQVDPQRKGTDGPQER